MSKFKATYLRIDLLHRRSDNYQEIRLLEPDKRKGPKKHLRKWDFGGVSSFSQSTDGNRSSKITVLAVVAHRLGLPDVARHLNYHTGRCPDCQS